MKQEFWMLTNVSVQRRAQAVEFLAHARVVKAVCNKYFTWATITLQYGDKRALARVPFINEFDFVYRWDYILIISILRSYGLNISDNCCWASYNTVFGAIRTHAEARVGFDMVKDKVEQMLASGKREAYLKQKALDRAAAKLREARKYGATHRQMTGLIRTILNEETLAAVHND